MMWWLILPVFIYSAGLIILWLVLVYTGGPITPERTGRGSENASDTASLPGTGSVAVDPDTGNLPEITIVVAARNEEKCLPTLLESLLRQDYPASYVEIIIVNDNSTDRTPILVSEFIAENKDKSGPRMRLIYSPFSGKKKAVRYGIGKAAGEIILTTDADCIVGPGWVRSHASWYCAISAGQDYRDGGTQAGAASEVSYKLSDTAGDTDADIVLASVYQNPAGGFWSHFGAYEFSALQSITEGAAVAGFPVMCNAANMSFRREVYLRHAGELREDLPSGDDMFLLEAVMRGGGAARHDGRSAAAVETAVAVTAAALLRQRARWASKAIHLRGAPVIILAAATAACNAAVTAAVVTACFSGAYVPVAAAMYGIKAIPDYLLIAGEMRKRGNRMRVMQFIVSELVYPFYFIAVGVMSMFPSLWRFREK